MLSVTIAAVGSLKERYWREACEEYSKRMKAFCKLSIVEISEHRLPANPSPTQIAQSLEAESREILSLLARLPKNTEIFSLCIEGKTTSSEDFSQRLQSASLHASHLAFLIGGSHGLDESVKAEAHKLSMSPMTFPHQLARVMLLEQLYRAFSIAAGTKYHK